HVLPRPIHPGGAGGPGGGGADRIRGLTRQSHHVAVVIEVGAVVEGDADDEGTLAEGVIHGALECCHRARALALVAFAASADVDHVGTLVGGVHDSHDQPAGRVGVGGVSDFQ